MAITRRSLTLVTANAARHDRPPAADDRPAAPTEDHSASARDDQPTAPIGLSGSEPVDASALLDHRTRSSLIPLATAPAGRYLGVEDGGQTLVLALSRPITHVGRGLIADVRLEDPHVSRRHAIVALRGRTARVLDDRSVHGTFVNGTRVTAAELSDGDVIRFGRAVMRYLEVAPVRTEPVRWRPHPRRAEQRPRDHRGRPGPWLPAA